MKTSPCSWMRAEYHLPTLSSCRVPMTSITSARALPTPGPATVRLALIRTGIEVFGMAYMESVLFPLITALPLHIRPPERVALTPHVLHAYKIEDKTQQQSCAPSSREMAHAEGPLTIYLHLPIPMQDRFRQLLQMIGYWGQASSLACCTRIEHGSPPLEECLTPLHLFQDQAPLRPFFSSLLVSVPRHHALLARCDASAWQSFPQSSALGDLRVASRHRDAPRQRQAAAPTAFHPPGPPGCCNTHLIGSPCIPSPWKLWL